MAGAHAADAPSVKLQTTPGQTLPALEFKDEKGPQTLKPEGKLAAVHFWATWCVPCIAELPQVDATQKAYGEKGLKITTISLDTNLDKVKKFFSEHQINNLGANLDNNTKSFQAVQAKGLPATLFFNAQGQVIARADGPIDWNTEDMKTFLETNLK